MSIKRSGASNKELWLMIVYGFCSVFENHFKHIIKDDNHREIKGKDYTVDYFADDEKTSYLKSLYV